MVENRRRENRRRGFSNTESIEELGCGLKADFSQTFCFKCKQLRNLLQCSSDDIERCITIYYIDVSLFTSEIVIPTMLPFCLHKCTSTDREVCKIFLEDIDRRALFRCFISIKAKELGQCIDKFLIEPSNSLLMRACDSNINDVFVDDTEYLDHDCFEAIVKQCKGNISKLTEEIMSVDSRIYNAYVVSKKDTKVLKKDFFFKEKII